MDYIKEQVEQWKAKAEKWDKLDDAIAKFYCNADGEYDEDNPEFCSTEQHPLHRSNGTL